MCLVEIVGIVTLIIHVGNTADSLNTAAGILSMTKTTVRMGPSGLTSHVVYTRRSAAQPAYVMLSANNCSICNFAFCLSLIGKQFEIIVSSHYQSQLINIMHIRLIMAGLTSKYIQLLNY